MVTRLTKPLIAGVTLASVVTALVASTVPAERRTEPAAVAQEEIRTRRDIREVEVSPEELKNLRHAFFMIRKQPATCGDAAATSEYDCWAAYHNNFSDFGCRHLTDLFWPWHRHHLAEFEKALRRSDPAHPERVANVTLPYWNWGQPASGKNFPKALEQEFLKPGEFYPEDCPDPANCRNPLWAANRRTVAACQSVKEECVNEAVALTEWAAFGGDEDTASAFELQAHNFMHSRYIQGLMGRPSTAARDSIYWLFHAYIDRVWDQWQQRHQTDPCVLSNVPNPERTLTLGAWPPASVRFQDVLCTSALKYRYSDGPIVASALPSCPPENAMCVTATTETPVVMSSTVRPEVADHVELRLAGVTVPTAFSYDAWVLLHPAKQRYRPKDKAFAARYAAASFSVWRSDDHRSSSASHLMHVRLDVTRGMRRLAERAEAGPLAATLVLTAADRRERGAPIVFGKDVDVASAVLIVQANGQTREVPLTVRP